MVRPVGYTARKRLTNRESSDHGGYVMAVAEQGQMVRTEFWSHDAEEAKEAYVEVGPDEHDPVRLARHTFVDGHGSVASFYLDREDAIRLAHRILGSIAR